MSKLGDEIAFLKSLKFKPQKQKPPCVEEAMERFIRMMTQAQQQRFSTNYSAVYGTSIWGSYDEVAEGMPVPQQAVAEVSQEG